MAAVAESVGDGGVPTKVGGDGGEHWLGIVSVYERLGYTQRRVVSGRSSVIVILVRGVW